MEQKPMNISIIELPDETVEHSAYKYVVIVDGEGVYRPKGAAYPNLYLLMRVFHAFDDADWTEIEAALAKKKVWKRMGIMDQNLQRAMMNL